MASPVEPPVELELATEEISLDDASEGSRTSSSPTIGLGLNVPGAPMGRSTSNSSNVSAVSASSGASKVRAAAAMWENKDSKAPSSPTSRPSVGRKRSGTTATRPTVTPGRNGAEPLGANSSPGTSPSPTGFRSVEAKSTSSLKPLRLGGSARSTTKGGTPPVPSMPEHSPSSPQRKSPTKMLPERRTSSSGSTPDHTSLLRSPLSTYDSVSIGSASPQHAKDEEVLPSALGLETIAPLDEQASSPAEQPATRSRLGSVDTVYLSPSKEETELQLDTVDLNASPEKKAAPIETGGSVEPETIVTPASPLVSDPSKALPSQSLLSPNGEVPQTESPRSASSAGFADVPLTPAKSGNSPQTIAGPTRMASLFTSVLYGSKPATREEPEKPVPPPKPSSSRNPSGSGKSFFTSAASNFSFNLPSLPVRTTSDSSPTIEQPAALSVTTNLEPKPAASWRTTMSSFLSSRGSGSGATVTSAAPLSSNSSSSTNLLLHRLDDPTSVRDRRISREYGGGDRLREGFERVRNEMEGAARDIRRELARGEELDVEGVDWAFWGSVVQDYEDVARQQPKELSRAIQQGIPAVFRGPIWQLMSSSKSAELEETYKALLKLTSPHEKAIHKDINRTFPNHKFFTHTGAGQDGLFMVVKAYSLYDREVGYTQGIAFIVAALLLNMPDEEAFCVLVRLMDSYNLRSHYLADMPGLQLRLYQFDRLLEDVLPLLHSHLVRIGVKTSMYASQWFMTLFSYRFPLSLVYRVFDIVLAEGIEAIFRFAIALLKKTEDDLLKLEFDQILNVLQGDLFEAYRSPESEQGDSESIREKEWLTNDFVRDAYAIHITPLMLDHYEAEWEEKCRAQNEHARELDQLRSANRHLSAQVKSLESSLATMNQEHVEMVRQLVLAKIAKEDMENELVKYKSVCAALSQANPDVDVDAALATSGSRVDLSTLRTTSSSGLPSSRSTSPH